MNAIPPLLDHLVLATPDLASTVAEFAGRTGVTPVVGGAHPDLGTRNYLVSLGGSSYLEIIGPDPEQSLPEGAHSFGVDGLTEARTVTWAISPPDLDAAVAAARAQGYDPGTPHPMNRRRPDGTLLEWRLTDSDTAHPSGLVPFLIDWGASPHPTTSGLPTTPLREVSATAPDTDEIRTLLTALNTELHLSEGPVGFTFTVETPKGHVTFR
ncbi:VOC family protein [Streptomyces sp. NPDC054794]